jgi:hypothetical protein
MPKKQTKKFIFKASRKSFLISLICTLVLLGVVSQIAFDRMIWQEQQGQATFRMRTLIGDAINGLNDLKSSPNANNQIPEVRLQLPPETTYVARVTYLVDKNYDTSEVEDVMVTTKSLSSIATGQMNGANDMNTLFDMVPQAQACSRGFTLQFKPTQASGTTFKLSGTVNLHDGRTLYVYREPACKVTGVDELEKYLLQAQSY